MKTMTLRLYNYQELQGAARERAREDLEELVTENWWDGLHERINHGVYLPKGLNMDCTSFELGGSYESYYRGNIFIADKDKLLRFLGYKNPQRRKSLIKDLAFNLFQSEIGNGVSVESISGHQEYSTIATEIDLEMIVLIQDLAEDSISIMRDHYREITSLEALTHYANTHNVQFLMNGKVYN